jgi:hypothetical protein
MDVDDQVAQGLRRLIDQLMQDYLIAHKASDPDRANRIFDQIAALHYATVLVAEDRLRGAEVP